MSISVVVPAYNEALYLRQTLDSIQRASRFLNEHANVSTEIIVVDNRSDDATAQIAELAGARVVEEPEHNIARVRNKGADAATGEVLVFIDADVVVPENVLLRIEGELANVSCLGGAVDTKYESKKHSVRVYLLIWRLLGRSLGMAQGATQFCRRDVFALLHGYDETLYMGEDVDFFWRLKRLAKHKRGLIAFIKDVRVIPSTRRFDQHSFGKLLFWTNPIFILLFRRRKTVWQNWYSDIPR